MKKDNKKSQVAVLGIDLAKKSFQLHGVDQSGNTVLRKKLSRKLRGRRPDEAEGVWIPSGPEA